MPDNKFNSELCECIESIEAMFGSDAMIFLDTVLVDDPTDPEYSANMAYHRLNRIVEFQELYYGKNYNHSVAEYMLRNGYTKKDVALLNAKRIDENRRHKRAVGIWGYKLYQNDTSLDIKGEFESLFNDGKTPQEITDTLKENYESVIDDREEGPLFWLTLADMQWRFGILLPEIKEKALYWIDKIDTSANTRLKRELDDLKDRLSSTQPPTKKPVKKRIYKCQWKLGDVFAYKLESELAKERGFYGRYFLIRKVDESTWYPGHIIPVVYVKITADTQLPTSIEEYERAEYVQTWFSRYEERFWPIDMSCPREDIARKSKLDYNVDEYGFLLQYRVRLINTSKRIIPKKLIYIGNFINAAGPAKEFIPHVKENIVSTSWKVFETKMIERYCGHNLRELSIYSGTNKA